MNGLKKSMEPVASFKIQNSTDNEVKINLFPGHYDTTELVKDSNGKPIISHANPSALCDAGYTCDQVADDFNTEFHEAKGSNAYPVKITPKSTRTRYRDFLNYIKYSGLRVSKIRITDLNTGGNHEIFGQELEVSASSIGSKAGSDFIQLSSHIDPSNYLQNFIDIDLAQRNLLLDETTLAFLTIPGKANFLIDFTLSEVK
ncbi:MAG: hypothetical protein IKU01_02455 [Bacteroidales bacterium]|nr:hypothetical protein [Bacteroidales bacterium]